MSPDHLLVRLARRRPGAGEPRRAALAALLAHLEHPERGVPVVQIAGSRGKGSTALLLESVLEAAAFHTGVFTSPHLRRWTERFRLAGREIPAARLDAILTRLEPAVAALDRSGLMDRLSFFDAATAAALYLFREAAVDCAILEAGLGGGRDATCLARPALTCLTGVELEHAALLGGSLEAVAREKAAIARPGVPLILGALPATAATIVRSHARRVGAPVFALGEHFEARVRPTERGCRLRFRSPALDVDIELPLLGLHLGECAALALACATHLVADRERLRNAAVNAWSAVSLPGRTEVLATRPWLVVDGAHTPDAMSALAAALTRLPHTGLELVVSVAGERDPALLCAALRPMLRRVTTTCAEPGRSLPAAPVAERLRRAWPEMPVQAVAEPETAVAAALERAGADGTVAVAGSVYLAGRALAWHRVRWPSEPGTVAK